MKRIGLFLLTNLAVMLVLGVVLSVVTTALGIQSGSMGYLLIFAGIFGFGGSLISLMMSKGMAIRSTRAQVIESPKNEREHWLYTTVQRQAQQAGIGMPTVAIYPANEINAFATGAKRNDALVAVSSGLLDQMTKEEAEAVLAHEVSHVANGDMITMTLIQGVVNTFVIFISRIIAGAIASRTDDDGVETTNTMTYFITSMVLELVFGMLANTITMWFSRRREFKADAGGAYLAGRENMIKALQRLQSAQQDSQLEGSMSAFGITGKKSIAEFFMSHPPLEKRIEALKNLEQSQMKGALQA